MLTTFLAVAAVVIVVPGIFRLADYVSKRPDAVAVLRRIHLL
jgi:hypothetical protein